MDPMKAAEIIRRWQKHEEHILYTREDKKVCIEGAFTPEELLALVVTMQNTVIDPPGPTVLPPVIGAKHDNPTTTGR